MDNKHNYFGKISQHEFGAGFQSEHSFHIPHFEKDVIIYLGDENDEDWEVIETPPTEQELEEYQLTFKLFLEQIDSAIDSIKEAAFEHYKKYYAKYYETDFEVIFTCDKLQESKNGELHPPLTIDTKEKHFEYMTEILESIRISDKDTIRIPIHYDLDQEHGLELKLVKNKVVAIGGISDT